VISKKEFSEYAGSLSNLFESTGVLSVIPKAHCGYIEKELIAKDSEVKTIISERTDLIAKTLEGLASDLYLNDQISIANQYFDDAFICRRELVYRAGASTESLFLLAVDALGAGRSAELRLILDEFEISKPTLRENWPELIKESVLIAFLFVCRKKNGWNDITSAVEIIQELRKFQAEMETNYFETIADISLLGKFASASNLVALYNMAKIIDVTASYLINGSPADSFIKLRKHYDNAVEAIQKIGDASLEIIIDLLFVGSDSLLRNSIWFNTDTLGKEVRRLVQELTSSNNENPFIELWPSQQQALRSSLFDPAKKSVVLEMPTSAGKTLMAEFAIVQSRALNPDSVIVYVVPTRALVNQITLQLRRDLAALKIVVEAAVPVFELDPTEDELLRKSCDILVSTPEKIELLIRSKHPVVERLSLVIADEIHNIAMQGRGSVLELFLGTVAREKPTARFLLMSPFIPNAAQLGAWLGGDRTAPIKIQWKPSERITAAAFYVGRRPRSHIQLRMLPSAHNSTVKECIDVPIDSTIVEGSKTKSNVALSTAISLTANGGVLLLCGGRDSAVNKATKAIDYVPKIDSSPFLDICISYLKDEFGESHILPKILEHGVAFHHAGLSQESRYLIERLVSRGLIRLVCATTTLAQGVNFPIRSVVVEGVTRSTETTGHQKIPFNEFWNIAGRAGRAMKDHLGLIIFAARDNDDIKVYEEYLRGDASEVLSSILGDLLRIEEINEKFDLNFVAHYPSLARFFQYLLHAITISNYDSVVSEIDSILRSSLVYHQVGDVNSAHAKKLLQVARQYLQQVQKKAANKGFLELIDGTGFSSATVDYLFSQRDVFVNSDVWDQEKLFAKGNDTLTQMVAILSGIPELDLTRLGSGVLDVEAIANIIKDWVKGESVEEIADRYFSAFKDKDTRILRASQYIHAKLTGQLAWGMSALQKVSLFGQEDVKWESIGHTPSLMFYGVSSREAATLRMVGVPRMSANKLAEKFKSEISSKDTTFHDIRSWLDKVEPKEWGPAKSTLSGSQSKAIWKILNGDERSL